SSEADNDQRTLVFQAPDLVGIEKLKPDQRLYSGRNFLIGRNPCEERDPLGPPLELHKLGSSPETTWKPSALFGKARLFVLETERMRRKFVGAFWVALLCVVLGEEQPEAEEDRITLGLYVLYDDAFNNRAAFKQSDEELTSYFTVLVNTAQAYFRGLRDPSLTLTLVGSKRLWDQEIISYVEENRKKFVDAAATLPRLEDAVRWNKSVPEGVDVVFLITGIETKTREDSFTKDWKGLSVPKTICFSAGTEMAKAAGIAHDDGETFNGATVMALQVALLLGASKDSRLTRRCPSTGGFLTSSMKGGIHPYLSECSKNALQGFYYRHL
ncbi:hypothetical protein V5799_006054, partial [Amblyomma americanum]